jgi:hypothetical protein
VALPQGAQPRSTSAHNTRTLTALLAPRQVYMILDEFILAGEIQETSKKARQQRSVSRLRIV